MKVVVLSVFLAYLALVLARAASNGDEYVSRPITDRNYKKILRENPNVFVKFFTNWCYYSKQIFDIWENVGDHYAYNKTMLIAEVDCEDYKSLCRNYKVREYPALIMFKDGVKFEKYVGLRTKEDIIDYIDSYLQNPVALKDEV